MLETAKVFPGKKRKGDLATSQQLPYYITRNVSLAATADKLLPKSKQRAVCSQVTVIQDTSSNCRIIQLHITVMSQGKILFQRSKRHLTQTTAIKFILFPKFVVAQ